MYASRHISPALSSMLKRRARRWQVGFSAHRSDGAAMSEPPPHNLTVPDTLAARPWDARRGVPIPPVSVHERDGRAVVDFVTVNGPIALALARARDCSLCGQRMGYWVAFLGGPASHAQRRYLDPPAHPECMLAAVRLCPFIALRHHRRAPEHRVGPDTASPPGYEHGQPDRWLLGITRRYRVEIQDDIAVYLPAAFKRTRTFDYDAAGHIREQPGTMVEA